jgi:Zn-dependent membrane protease YugP
MLFVILIGFMILGFAVQSRLKSKFKKYSKEMISSGLTGREVAERMLRDNGIYDVNVVSVSGRLTDHYNPANKTVNLSQEVFNSNSISAAAVAAHECGHAVQHAEAYSWLGLRTALVPIVNFSGNIMNAIFILGFIGFGVLHLFPMQAVLYTLIFAQGAIALFSLITLHVEYDASNRAMLWIERTGISSSQQQVKAKDALTWASRTYLVAALAAVTQLLYYVMMFMGGDD